MNNASSTETVVSVPSSSSSGTSGNALSVSSSGLGAPGAVTAQLAHHAKVISANEHISRKGFRDHPRVVTLLSVHARVELVSVTIFVSQRNVFPAESKGTPLHVIRYGLLPAGTVGKSGGLGVVSYLPALATMSTNVGSGATSCTTWGRGGLPFPPGLQLDLASVEVRFKYPEVAIANMHVTDKTHELVVGQIDFTVECSGQGDGVLYH